MDGVCRQGGKPEDHDKRNRGGGLICAGHEGPDRAKPLSGGKRRDIKDTVRAEGRSEKGA